MSSRINQLTTSAIDLTKVFPFQIASGDIDPVNNTLQALKDAFSCPAVYVAVLSQSGSAAPTASVSINELGGTVVWTRQIGGLYVATLAGAFTEGKTIVSISQNTFLNTNFGFQTYHGDEDTIGLCYSGATYGSFTDFSANDYVTVEIRVYP